MGLPLEQVTLPARRLDAAGGADRRRLVARRHRRLGRRGRVREAAAASCWQLARARCPARRSRRRGFDDVEFADGAMRLRGRRRRRAAARRASLAASRRGRASRSKYLLLPNVLKQRKYTRATHSAVFCEVRVDEELRHRARHARGQRHRRRPHHQRRRPRAARSSAASSGASARRCTRRPTPTTRSGRFMNHNFAEYHVAGERRHPRHRRHLRRRGRPHRQPARRQGRRRDRHRRRVGGGLATRSSTPPAGACAARR